MQDGRIFHNLRKRTKQSYSNWRAVRTLEDTNEDIGDPLSDQDPSPPASSFHPSSGGHSSRGDSVSTISPTRKRAHHKKNGKIRAASIHVTEHTSGQEHVGYVRVPLVDATADPLRLTTSGGRERQTTIGTAAHVEELQQQHSSAHGTSINRRVSFVEAGLNALQARYATEL